MCANQVIVEGRVNADGTLVLSAPVNLPPGAVRVIVQAESSAQDAVRNFGAFIENLHASQKARGHQPRTREEIDAEVQKLRDESEEDLQEASELHRQYFERLQSSEPGNAPGPHE